MAVTSLGDWLSLCPRCLFVWVWLTDRHGSFICIDNVDPQLVSIFSFSALTLLVGRQERHPGVKSWKLVCWRWLFDWSFAHLIAPVVTTTTSIILGSNKTGYPRFTWKMTVKTERERERVSLLKNRLVHCTVSDDLRTLRMRMQKKSLGWSVSTQLSPSVTRRRSVAELVKVGDTRIALCATPRRRVRVRAQSVCVSSVRYPATSS